MNPGSFTPEEIPNVGDKLWMTTYSGLAVEVTVTEVDDYRITTGPGGQIYFWVDEPAGHALDFHRNHCELVPTRRQAVETIVLRECEVQKLIDEDEEAEDDADYVSWPTLDSYRRRALGSIMHSHLAHCETEADKKLCKESFIEHFQQLSKKERYVQWFTLEDITNGRVPYFV